MQSYHNNNNNADLAQEEEAASGANRVQNGTGRKLPGLPKGTTGCPCGRDVVVSSSVSPPLPLLLPLQMRHSSSYTNKNIAAKTKQKILRRGGDLRVCRGRKKKEFGLRMWFVNPSPQKIRWWCRRRRRTRNRVCWSLSSVVLARRSFRKLMDRRRRRSSSSSSRRSRRRSKRRKEKVSSVREKPDCFCCCCCRFSLQRRGSTAITHARTTYKTVTTTMRSTCKATRWACAVSVGWKERANDWVLHLLTTLWKHCKSWMRRHDNLASAQKKPHQQQQEPLLLVKKSLITMLITATAELATSCIHVIFVCVCVCVCVSLSLSLSLSHSLSLCLSVSLSIFCFCFFASLNAPLFLLMFKLQLFVRVSSSNKPQQTNESN